MVPAKIPEAPPWAHAMVDPGDGKTWREIASGFWLRHSEGEKFTLLSVFVEDAVALDETAFHRTTTQAYQAIQTALKPSQRQPVRLWNFVPGILQPLGSLTHRYMAFNAGRYDAYRTWLGTGEDFERLIPTASGVGHSGEGLVIHCLAASTAGRPIENPRQTPSYTYSSRYGPKPPCFARATRLEDTGRRWLLVGGTASVVGEESTHHDDLEAQLDETLGNLRALVGAAWTTDPASTTGPTSARIYFVRNEDEAFLRAVAPQKLNTREVEFLQSDLCRPDLLVEIEAFYDLPAQDETAAA